MTREYRGESAESDKTDVGVEEGQDRGKLHIVAFYGVWWGKELIVIPVSEGKRRTPWRGM
jgi:hypothetical protein